MKNELNEYLLSRIIIDLTKIKKILEDSDSPEAKIKSIDKINNLLVNIQEMQVQDNG